MPEQADLLAPMRVATLTRLLNATPLGVVAPSYRVYRHRLAAGGSFDLGAGVSLVRYAAWLRQTLGTGAGPCRRRRSRKTIGHDGSVNKAGVLALLQRQAYRCALTGWDLTPETAALDHIIPVSRGGEHRIDNAQVLTKVVNRAKGTLTNEEFIELCGAVWRHHPRPQPSDGVETSQSPARTAETSDVQPSLFSPQN